MSFDTQKIEGNKNKTQWNSTLVNAGDMGLYLIEQPFLL